MRLDDLVHTDVLFPNRREATQSSAGGRLEQSGSTVYADASAGTGGLSHLSTASSAPMVDAARHGTAGALVGKGASGASDPAA